MLVPRTDGRLPDRYVEIDLDWFDPGDRSGVERFVERTAPLWSGSRRERGVVVNPGFLVDIITEFGGDVDQELPLRSARYPGWSGRTYRDLAVLSESLRQCAQEAGIDGLRVGILVAGVGRVVTGSDLYDLESDWCDRHPELYPFDLSPLPGPDLDPRVPLAADDHRYAAFPAGLSDGTSFAEVLAGQWAAVSAACSLDVIHLRDGFWGPMLYTRRGPFGVTAGPDPAENQSWTEAVSDLFRAVKAARPDATVMAYTSGIGATAEWRSGCVDTEAVLAGGGVDILIDETWGGAWQDWWDDWWKGWTYQHTNLLSHGVAVRRCGQPVRHYKLIETWDGWEPFDTVHDVPEKLRWAMWAWSHAAVLTDTGLEVPDGTYVSWMNDRHLNLLDEDAVRFVASELDLAERDANRMTRVGGPLLVFDHDGVDHVHRTTPNDVVGEHLEDAAALLLKWGVPILGATTPEWLSSIDTSDGVITQLGAVDALMSLAVGSAAAVGAETLRRAGAEPTGDRRHRAYRRESFSDRSAAKPGWVFLPADARVVPSEGAVVLSEADEWPTVTSLGDRAWWCPPDLSDPSNPLLPRSQYGSVGSAVVVAHWWNERGTVTTSPVPEHLPVTLQWWDTTEGRVVLTGNLETGWIGDSRTPRLVEITIADPDVGDTTLTITTPPEGCTVLPLALSSTGWTPA